MNKIKFLALALVLGFVAISCGDDDSDAPIVNITSPAEGTTYAVTDTILITGSVTEDTKLQTVNITSNLGLNQNLSPLDSDTLHVLNLNLTLDAMTAAGNYTLTVTATDEAGNVGTDDVEITIQ
jgi:hypothetical protein